MREEKGTMPSTAVHHINNGDVRRLLCERKYFGLRPEPLQRYLYQLNVSRSAERVFWLHWDLGYRHGDFCSEVPVSEVARRVCLNASSVTRAYQCLRRHGLIRRQDQGRDPRAPFRALTAVTEVLLPRAVLAQLLAAPNRGVNRSAARDGQGSVHRDVNGGTSRSTQAAASVTPAAAQEVSSAAAAASVPAPSSTAAPECSPSRAQLLRLFAKLSERERCELWRAQRARAAGAPWHWQPSSTSALTAEEAAQLSALAAALAVDVQSARQAPASQSAGAVSSRAASGAPARVLNALSLAYLRRALARLLSGAELEERMREVVWSAERGALAKFEPRLALNIALKKVRLREWTRPHRMPARWRCALA